MNPKRKKPFAATLASEKYLTAEGWTCARVEQRLPIPNKFITRDAYGFGDLLCCSPTRGVMLVQVTGGTSTSNFHARVEKIRANPIHVIWLASGGRIQVHSWEKRVDCTERALRILEIQKQEPQTELPL